MARSLSIGKAVPGYPYTSPNFSKNIFLASHFSSDFTDAYVPFSNWKIWVKPKKPNMTRIQFNAQCKNKQSSEAFSSQKNLPIARNPNFLSVISQSNLLFWIPLLLKPPDASILLQPSEIPILHVGIQYLLLPPCSLSFRTAIANSRSNDTLSNPSCTQGV